MKVICAGKDIVKGIDVSGWQPAIRWDEVKAAGYDFCFVKASEGVSVKDKNFKNYWKDSKAAGMVRGAYHYFHSNIDPVDQANFFLSVVGELDELDTLVIDWEAKATNVSSSQNLENGLEFIYRLEKVTQKKPIIYTGPYYAKDNIASSVVLKEYPLWIAHYQTNCPMVPPQWDEWKFWQYTDSELVRGVGDPLKQTRVDANKFNGSLEDLKKLIKSLSLKKSEEIIVKPEEIIIKPRENEVQKAYDLQDLGKKLADQGLPVLEKAAGQVYIAVKAWLKESAVMSDNKIDDFIAPQLDLLDPIVLPQIDKIDGVVG